MFNLYVREDERRKGIGTAMYEAAAKEACRRRGRLASVARGPESESNSFWLKQLRKGRAERWTMTYVEPKKRDLDPVAKARSVLDFHRKFDVFVLKSCEKPIDLSGLVAWCR